MIRTEGTFFARTEHGGHKVLADDTGFTVCWPSGKKSYPSARQTILALVNQAPDLTPSGSGGLKDPRITFDRYFRRGSYRATPMNLSLDVFSLFTPKNPIEVDARPDVVRGIDLAKRGHEVRKLFYAGFGRRVARYGYDPEDVLQEVYKGLLVRNRGKCPFDPAKSSFGHYVHMVCGCIVSNYRRKYARLEKNEQFGVENLDGEIIDVRDADLVITDADQDNRAHSRSVLDGIQGTALLQAGEAGIATELAEQCLSLMAEGYRKKEIVQMTGESDYAIGKAIKFLRRVARDWTQRGGDPA